MSTLCIRVVIKCQTWSFELALLIHPPTYPLIHSPDVTLFHSPMISHTHWPIYDPCILQSKIFSLRLKHVISVAPSGERIFLIRHKRYVIYFIHEKIFYSILWPDFMWCKGKWFANGDQSVRRVTYYDITMGTDITMDIHCVMSQWVMMLLCVHIMALQCVMIFLWFSLTSLIFTFKLCLYMLFYHGYYVTNTRRCSCFISIWLENKFVIFCKAISLNF